eukprot:TRINITY_DN3541_c0_g1_i1.p2 TRINITY_DN3541_c0_g1~~TRINITY_DN3541_c0_g1_i1.p2  ORF type:complete len:446 (+),score=82.23 TRINITY_DN3541_c0_g1_i1:3653-4990(+)
MEDNANQWGTRREDYYANEKEGSENAEEDEYNEILKLQEIRAKKIKLAQANPSSTSLIESAKFAEPETKSISFDIAAKPDGLQKVEDMPKSIGQTPYGKDLLAEYEKAYQEILATSSSQIKDKYNEVKRSALLQYANNLQRLIQAKSQNLEANDLIEDVIHSKSKVEALEALKPIEVVKEQPKQKKVKAVSKPKILETPSIVKRKVKMAEKNMVKTSLIIAGGSKQAEDKIAEELAAPLPQKGHSYLADYLTGNLPAVKEDKAGTKKKKEKVKAEAKMRHIENPPSPVEEDEFYQKVLQEKQKTKEEKVKRLEEKEEEKKEKAKEMFSQAQRNINYSILKAKGLTRKRNKRDRNPRIKLKYKYDKAVRQRKVLFMACNKCFSMLLRITLVKWIHMEVKRLVSEPDWLEARKSNKTLCVIYPLSCIFHATHIIILIIIIAVHQNKI